jgi:hemoglobin
VQTVAWQDGHVHIEPTPPEPGMTFYEAIGGEDVFQRLVAEFYRRVPTDAVLSRLYPQDDLGPAEDRLRWFLIQYWGGPTTYGERRGHPRLRARHAGFRIDAEARDAWLANMRAALDTLGLPTEYDRTLWAYLYQTAHAMVNEPA